MSDLRVMVFIDYQNTYRATRACFHDHEIDPSYCGQVKPIALGQTIVSMIGESAVFSEVRVYRGLPSSDKDPKAYGAARRQITSWQRDSRVKVIARPLKYPPTWSQDSPREKGVDVSLAVDFVSLAVMGKYDVGVMVSLDTDLIPALEFVHLLGTFKDGLPRPEVAAWGVANHERRRLQVKGATIPCRWLTEKDYPAIRDLTAYADRS